MKIEDMLLGIAIGDAFGVCLEFQDRDWIRKNIYFTASFKEKVEGREKLQNLALRLDNYLRLTASDSKSEQN